VDVAPLQVARTRRSLLLAPAATALGAAAAVGAATAVGRLGLPLLLPCPLHALTGLWCPLCGGTRAVQALAGGDVGAALSLNALVVVAVPLLVLAWVRWTARRASGQAASMVVLGNRGLTVVAGVLVVFGVLRNLPGLEALAP
jgi:hypothetical protein